ncbi:4520_t:CDS:2 [Acaulospora colombiana]|uniref:4520_t:CDS:1 n=1 Tax=Acaulospora colombiana TaxID=27376 RepID=A0ACA9K6Y5_9GLOM|nr:4520_t:CDS:2 [Acaulospora colombiana]
MSASEIKDYPLNNFRVFEEIASLSCVQLNIIFFWMVCAEQNYPKILKI